MIEGWVLVHATDHLGPSGICMVWEVRSLFDPEYKLTMGSEGNLKIYT